MTTALTGTKIKTTYGDVLQLGNSGAGWLSSLTTVYDGLGNATTVPVVSNAAVASIAWVGWWKADALPVVADGTAVSSWANSSSGSADAAVQATGAAQPAYKIAANGINGVPVVRFDGSDDYLRTTVGGASLSGSFYMACVCRFTSISGYQSLVAFGEDATAGHRRAMLKYATDVNTPQNAVTFNANNADDCKCMGNGFTDSSLPAETNSTVHLHEITWDGKTLSVYRDGTLYGRQIPGGAGLVAYTATTITLGADPGAGEPFNGDLAEVFLLGSLPTAAQIDAVRSYVATKYALTVASGKAVAEFSAASTIVDGFIYDVGGTVCVGSPVAIAPVQNGTAAAMTVNGPLTAYAQGDEHLFKCYMKNNNVGAVQNANTGGFSTWRYLRYSGEEHSAVGYANPGNGPWGETTYGSTFVEFSNFHDSGIYGDLRFVQTKTGGNTKVRSRWRYDTQAIEEYDLTWAEPSASGPTAGLVSLRGLPVVSVSNNGTTNTGITTPAFGVVVVKDTTNNKGAVFVISNTTFGAALAGSDAEFTTTLNNAATVNIYNSGGQLVIQNKTGGSLNLTASYWGC